jgi:cytochrome P450
MTASAPRRVEAPERIDLDAAEPLLRPLWNDSARDVLRSMLTGEPRHPPGARLAPSPSGGDPLLGHLRAVRSDPLSALLRWQREVGDVARVQLAGVTLHVLAHPDTIRAVLQERARQFTRPIQGRRNLSNVLGNGLLVSEGSFWLRQRRLAQPAFHKRRIEGFADGMVAASADLAEQWAEREARGERFDVARDMMHLTLRIVQETLLGATRSDDADRIGEAVSYLLADVNRRFGRLINPPTAVPTAGNQRFARHLAVLDRAVHRMIEDRRVRPGRDDLLSMLLEARDEDSGEGMDDRQLRDEVMTIFLAGHETTANALSWTFYLLGRHPEVARTMRAELRDVLGGRPPRAEDVANLRYTRMVFSEAMRLYPPAWIVARAPIEDVEVAGYFMPAGGRIFVSPWLTHRHPKLWRDPEGFDPTRFADPSAIDRFAWFPFGGGPRLCIGHAFAMMEGILVLATLAQRFHLELVPGHRVEPEPLVTLRPKNGVLVRARQV